MKKILLLQEIHIYKEKYTPWYRWYLDLNRSASGWSTEGMEDLEMQNRRQKKVLEISIDLNEKWKWCAASLNAFYTFQTTYNIQPVYAAVSTWRATYMEIYGRIQARSARAELQHQNQMHPLNVWSIYR